METGGEGALGERDQWDLSRAPGLRAAVPRRRTRTLAAGAVP